MTEILASNPVKPCEAIGHSDLCASRLVEPLAPDARQRQKAGRRALDGPKGKSAAIAGAQYGVSARAVEQARAVLARGDPDLVKAIEDGKLSISVSAKLAAKAPPVQREA